MCCNSTFLLLMSFVYVYVLSPAYKLFIGKGYPPCQMPSPLFKQDWILLNNHWAGMDRRKMQRSIRHFTLNNFILSACVAVGIKRLHFYNKNISSDSSVLGIEWTLLLYCLLILNFFLKSANLKRINFFLNPSDITVKFNIFNKRRGTINFSIDEYFLKIILECYHFCPELPCALTFLEVAALGFPAPFSYYSQSTINVDAA